MTDGREIFYTRDGALGLDAEGTLVHLASGLRVVAQGMDATAVVGAPSASSTLQIPVGQMTLSTITSKLLLGGNLQSDAAPGTVVNISLAVFDSLGAEHQVTLKFTRSVTAAEWAVSGASADGTLSFPTNGTLVSPPKPAEIAGAAIGLPLTLQSGVNDEIKLNVNGGVARTLDLVATDTTFTSLSALRDAVNNAINADAGAAQVTGTAAPTSLTIDATNDQLKIGTDGGATQTITLAQATYASTTALAAEIQSKADAVLGSGVVTVGVSGGAIQIARASSGAGTSLQVAEGNAGLANLNIAAATEGVGLAGLVSAKVVDSHLVLETTGGGSTATVTITSGAKDAVASLGFTSGASGTGVNSATTPASVVQFTQFGAPVTKDLDFTFVMTNPDGAQNPQTITANFEAVTQQAVAGNIAVRSQDGAPPGLLTSFRFDPDGVITGVFDNGLSAPVGQLQLAQFQNPAGLAGEGQSIFGSTANSGTPIFGKPGEGSLGTIQGGQLEGSNVDLGQEFADMIVTQRSFQANSRVITTSDQMLQELISIVR